MDNKEFSKLFENRTKVFAIKILKLSAMLPTNTESLIIRNQISKSGTSIGANYREANRSKSKADFSYKIKLCEGEANETVYWLDIIEEMNWIDSNELSLIKIEANEILAILTSISKKLRAKNY